MNQKLLIAGILIAGILSIGQHLAIQQQQQVQASKSNFFENLGDDLGKGLKNLGRDIDQASGQYNQGYQDGKLAGVSGTDKDCPSSDTAYCVGFTSGYNRGAESRSIVDEAQARDYGEFVENED